LLGETTPRTQDFLPKRLRTFHIRLRPSPSARHLKPFRRRRPPYLIISSTPTPHRMTLRILMAAPFSDGTLGYFFLFRDPYTSPRECALFPFPLLRPSPSPEKVYPLTTIPLSQKISWFPDYPGSTFEDPFGLLFSSAPAHLPKFTKGKLIPSPRTYGLLNRCHGEGACSLFSYRPFPPGPIYTGVVFPLAETYEIAGTPSPFVGIPFRFKLVQPNGRMNLRRQFSAKFHIPILIPSLCVPRARSIRYSDQFNVLTNVPFLIFLSGSS